MCILFFYLNPNAEEGRYQLILANNRDEFYTRPTKPAEFWGENNDCISGKPTSYLVGVLWFLLRCSLMTTVCLSVCVVIHENDNKWTEPTLCWCSSDDQIGLTRADPQQESKHTQWNLHWNITGLGHHLPDTAFVFLTNFLLGVTCVRRSNDNSCWYKSTKLSFQIKPTGNRN